VSAKDNPSETMAGSLHGIFVLGDGNDKKHQHVTPVIQQILGASGQPLGELIRAVKADKC
jgi:hypothetical protein